MAEKDVDRSIGEELRNRERAARPPVPPPDRQVRTSCSPRRRRPMSRLCSTG